MAFQYGDFTIPYQQYSHQGNSAQWAVDKFREILGRNPTASELAQATPIFMGSDPNVADVAAGTAFVSSIANSPEQVYRRQQEQYKKGAPEQYGGVTQAFQGLLGRAPTQEELDHFGSLLASGQVDQYQLQDFLKQQPEYRTRQDTEFRQGLSGELQGSDERYFREQIMPAIQANYAKQGRSFESSGFQNALGQAANQQNRERESYLAQLSAQQYAGRQGAARSDYENYIQQLQGRQNASLTAPYARQNELADYTIQKNAYEDYLRRYGKRGTSWIDSLGTGLNFANSFANLFKGWGSGGSGSPTNTRSYAQAPDYYNV